MASSMAAVHNNHRSATILSAEAVLSKLKSDGIFDNIRKLCVAAVQEEPSYRAQKEHVEIITRRFLQSYRWKESTTKNDVRSNLRSFILEEMKKPSVHVGASLDSLITKALESEATDLLPTIKSAVETMLHPAPSPDPAMLDTSTTSSSIGNTAEAGNSQHTSSAVSLELPIHLLEFSSTLPTVKKEFTRGKPKTRLLTTGDKKENGGKRAEPHAKSKVEEKHRESSKSKLVVDKEVKGESLVSKVKPSENIVVHSEPGSSSHKEESEPSVSSVEVDDSESCKDTLSETKDNNKKKSRQPQKEDAPTGKRSISRRQVRKRRVVLSSSEDEKEDEEIASPGDCESESHPPSAELAEKKNQGTEERQKTSNSEKGAESSSHDVVVTRSNRRVKPSRRYALSNQYQHEDKEEDEDIVSVEQQEKIAVEVEERECSPKQEQSPKRKKLEHQEEPVAKRLRRHK